jgi:hypothetical protein
VWGWCRVTDFAAEGSGVPFFWAGRKREKCQSKDWCYQNATWAKMRIFFILGLKKRRSPSSFFLSLSLRSLFLSFPFFSSSLYLFMYLSLSLPLSLPCSLFLFISLSLSFLSIFLPLPLSLSLPLSLPLSLSLSFSLSLLLSLLHLLRQPIYASKFLSLPHSLSLSLFLSPFLSLSHSSTRWPQPPSRPVLRKIFSLFYNFDNRPGTIYTAYLPLYIFPFLSLSLSPTLSLSLSLSLSFSLSLSLSLYLSLSLSLSLLLAVSNENGNYILLPFWQSCTTCLFSNYLNYT